MRVAQIKRWAWPVTCGVLALALALTLWTNHLLRENLDTYRRSSALHAEWCNGLKAVNAVCEETLVDVAARLGLDTEWMPLVDTALWRRASKSMTIRKARVRLGATAGSKDLPLGVTKTSKQLPGGIGGGTEADE